jgi:hypothetical protein
MSPFALTVIGALISTSGALYTLIFSATEERVQGEDSSSPRHVQRGVRYIWILACVPLSLSCYAMINPPMVFDLWGWGVSQGEVLSFTLRYDQIKEGAKIFEAPLHLSLPHGHYWSFFACLFSGVAVLSGWTRRALITRWASIAWIALILLWAISAPLTLGVEFSGASGLRSFIEASAFDLHRVLSFVPLEEGWYFAPQRLGALILALTMSTLVALKSEPLVTAQDDLVRFESVGQPLITLGALFCLAGCAWSLFQVGAFTWSETSGEMWTALISLSVASVISHRGPQGLALSLGALTLLSI